jgi:hypothetical protein
MSFWHIHIQSLVLQASLTSQATMPLYVVSLTISVFVPIIARAHGRRRSATARIIFPTFTLLPQDYFISFFEIEVNVTHHRRRRLA